MLEVPNKVHHIELTSFLKYLFIFSENSGQNATFQIRLQRNALRKPVEEGPWLQFLSKHHYWTLSAIVYRSITLRRSLVSGQVRVFSQSCVQTTKEDWRPYWVDQEDWGASFYVFDPVFFIICPFSQKRGSTTCAAQGNIEIQKLWLRLFSIRLNNEQKKWQFHIQEWSLWVDCRLKKC